jgi:hypothetical protein
MDLERQELRVMKHIAKTQGCETYDECMEYCEDHNLLDEWENYVDIVLAEKHFQRKFC